MMLLFPLIQAFSKNEIKYVLVGGLAVILHGHPRLTTDIDLVIGLEEKNALKAMNCLTELGFKPKVPVKAEDFANPDIRQSWVKEKGLVVFTMYHPSDPLTLIDIFVEEPLPFQEMLEESEIKDLNGTEVRIAGIKHLIQMKEKASRPKDIEDIEVLKELLKL